jgi:histidine ammonia-lyase
MIHKARLFFRQGIRQKHVQGKVVLDGHSLTMEQLSNLSTGRTRVEIARESWNQIHEARKVVTRLLEANTEQYFGINTGVGLFSSVNIKPSEMADFQVNLIRSHATGIGEVLPLEASRRIHALRINSLAKGYSGISPETLNCLIDLFNKGCVPYIP